MKVPYGIHDYKAIKSKDYIYIDKTHFIKKIEDIGEYLVFLRPRRFGKSLFTSMLYYYYDKKSIENFNELFNDTYIGKNKTSTAGSYYILKFDFSGINTEKDTIEKSFFRKIKVCIDYFNDYYNTDISINSGITYANEYLEAFLQAFQSKSLGWIYLIIDEYDHFANNVLTSDIELFNAITGKDGFVRSFYEILKTYAGTAVAKMYITGVTPITLDSLTSGFNMAINVSQEEELNEMLGFTENEVIKIMNYFNISNEYLYTIKENYNGYLFNKDSEIRVYNSNMVLYYARPFALRNKPPANLTDSNIVSDYTKITGMFDLYKNTDDKKKIIHDILDDVKIPVTIIDKFKPKLGFNKDEFLSLMYYLGLLTMDISYGNEIYLKTPNYIIKNIYFEYYYQYLNNELNANIDVRFIKDSVRELSQNNNIKPFIEVIENFLKEISNRNFIKFDEKYIKLLMITYIRLTDLYLVKTEYEVNGRYIDIALLPNSIFELNNYFIIEVKYISINNYSDKKLDEETCKAVNQINDYADCNEMKRINNLKKYVLVFVYDKCEVIQEV